MTAQTSPNPPFSVPARPSSAPPPASSSALSSSQNGLGRPSTPLGTTTRGGGGGGTTSSSLQRSLGPGGLAPVQPPPFDRERAEQALAAADLSLRSLDELRQLDAELDRISVDASELLTHALMMREKETQDKEVYNGMIQVRPFLLAGVTASRPPSQALWLRGTTLNHDSVLGPLSGPRHRRRQDEDLVGHLVRRGQRTETVRQRPVEVVQVERSARAFVLHIIPFSLERLSAEQAPPLHTQLVDCLLLCCVLLFTRFSSNSTVAARLQYPWSIRFGTSLHLQLV